MELLRLQSLQWFVVALFFIVYLCQGSPAKDTSNASKFKFLTVPKMFYAVPFGAKFKVDCTTNDPNVTTSLYRRQRKGTPWKKLLPKAGDLVKVGHVFMVLDFGISDTGQYQCRARNDRGDTIKWSDSAVNVILNPNLIPDVEINPSFAVTIKAGQSYNITCSSVAGATLQWLKRLDDGTQSVVPSIKTYMERDVTMNELNLILMIKNAQKSDAGSYRCLMTYQGKTNFKYTSLRVKKDD